MKTRAYHYFSLLAATFALLGFKGASGQNPTPGRHIPGQGYDIFQGAPVYGFLGQILVSPNYQSNIQIQVTLLQVASTNIPLAHITTNAAATNGAIPKSPYGPGYLGPYSSVWLPATNGFAGPMELRDGAGHLVPLLKRIVKDTNAYPAFQRWSIWEAAEQRKHTLSHFIPMMRFYQGREKLAYFQLESCFQIKEPGEYTLTVWPKIWKRPEDPSEDCDLYQRLDIPPVTATIKWP